MAESLQDALIEIEDFKSDKFKTWRSTNAKKVLGISMTISYMVETHPTSREFDSEQFDAAHTARYIYDLELDSSGNILGGEWYSNAHPDFLWLPREGSRALTQGDYYILGEEWSVNDPMSPRWQNLAQQLSAYGQPMGKIVEELIEVSRTDVDSEINN